MRGSSERPSGQLEFEAWGIPPHAIGDGRVFKSPEMRIYKAERLPDVRDGSRRAAWAFRLSFAITGRCPVGQEKVFLPT